VFLIWLALAGVVAWAATQKNRGPWNWFFIALLLSPLVGFIALAFAKPLSEQRTTTEAVQGTSKQNPMYPSAFPEKGPKTCSKCGKEFSGDQSSCPHCGAPA
jgi:hypothetical protein